LDFSKKLLLWAIIAILLVAVFNLFQNTSAPSSTTSKPFSNFLQDVEEGKVSDVTIQGNVISGHTTNNQAFSTYMPDNAEVVPDLRKQGVKITAMPPDDDMPTILGILISWAPMLLLIGVWIFFMRQMQGGSGKAMGFGKSKARLLTEKSGRVTFEDVAGIDEAKAELEEVVDFLRDPQKFQRLGGKIPKGVLLVGPPGTGKTLLARAIAGEANVPFFTISGSDFVEMFVGVGASRVRDMFEQGKKNAPCIIFIDEIDAVGRHRGAGLGGGNDEREQTLNQLLVEMDGFEANEGVILVAATNRPDVLDPALLRPGRFDRQVVVPNPDVLGREKILKVHARKTPLGPDVDLRITARGTPGFSGADLSNLVNEAALAAARKGKRVVTQAEFEEAKDKIMMGAERRSMVMSEDEKKMTAYHEAGHALLSLHSPDLDPVHKATIIPRGRALGLVMSLPEGDKLSRPRAYFEQQLAMALGGRVAEEVIFGASKVSTGASSDIKGATDMARAMVTEWGFSDKLGPVAYGQKDGEVFLGHSVATHKNLSEETAREVDMEIRRFIDVAHQRAREVINGNLDQLERIAQALLEYETVTGKELRALLDGEEIKREEMEAFNAGRRSSVPTSAPQTDEKKPPQGDGSAPTAES
jgi:cell division protease FtsH